VAGDLDDSADHSEPTRIQVDRVGTQSGSLAPAQAGTAGDSDQATVPVGHGREQLVPEHVASDDLFVSVLLASLRDPDVLARVVGDQPIAHRGP